VFLEHHHEHLGVDDRTGVEELHRRNLTADDTDGYGFFPLRHLQPFVGGYEVCNR
jgi:hypothetical protein